MHQAGTSPVQAREKTRRFLQDLALLLEDLVLLTEPPKFFVPLRETTAATKRIGALGCDGLTPSVEQALTDAEIVGSPRHADLLGELERLQLEFLGVLLPLRLHLTLHSEPS